MSRSLIRPLGATVAVLLAAVACGGVGTVPAPAPGDASNAPAAQPDRRAPANPADVRFTQGMIAHHAQALVMTELVPPRTTRPDIRLLAERIEVSQRDEIAFMQQWLHSRGVATPGLGHADHHGHGDATGHAGMPGMLTAEELRRLVAARGPEFERLFLELMIRHHEGALVMVAELFGSPGGGQNSDIYRFASDVDADQRMEIDRMRALLRASGPR